MNTLATIGILDTSIQYTDRPTVKVVIRNDDTILLLNRGLLPGGGIDEGESDEDAITRELREELGVSVKETQAIGAIIQYRNFLNKKYIVHGYTATLETTSGITNPQDEGEAQFTMQWLSVERALALVTESIEEAKLQSVDDDARQGKLFNLMTTYELLRVLV